MSNYQQYSDYYKKYRKDRYEKNQKEYIKLERDRLLRGDFKTEVDYYNDTLSFDSITNGYDFEEYLKTIFDKHGYYVEVTKRSGDQGADLVLNKNNEKIVVFPNGNVLTNKVYYSSLNDNYVAFTNEVIESDYITRISSYADELLNVSNGIILHNLIKSEGDKVGECVHEE